MNEDVKYVLSLQAVRDRTRQVEKVASAGKLNHFDYHEDRLGEVADFVVSVIKRDYGPDKYDTIPPHGRWQHFEVGGTPRISNLLSKWRDEGCDTTELTRRLIDLFFVSVLLDAGAGDVWKWTEPSAAKTYERSEGIAVASLYMFKEHAFSASTTGEEPIVDGQGLKQLTTETLANGFQISASNPMTGLDSRASLLRALGDSLLKLPDVFGAKGRPGNIVDYMIGKANSTSELDVLTFWDVLQTLLIPIWPKDRTTLYGHPIGDAWPLRLLQGADPDSKEGEVKPEHIQPFHKLTQWLTYSLTVPFERLLGLKWINTDALTALPEYRNGGLFVDLGVLSLKKESLDRGLKASGGDLPLYEAGDDVIIEWRAMTLVLIDKLYSIILQRMGDVHLTMAQLLEAGTWKSGREIAGKRRPGTKSSPILIKSDGTVF
ncbi:hypothetical protein BDZ85DRAFT_131987 [Elsinoe ampelina]|uniref:DUF1688 domain-containing protein n=1 Tax=Elsinoe ampelina TaxID=302913 RepID=A0A6A6G8F1_9PEZI|nr:hypothetical protein BDZ85DRAFT_131987 [Elsinoe ampelina]